MTLLSGPNICGNEWEYVKECLDTAWISSVGSYVTRFEEITADFTGSKHAVATSSGTTALHIALILAGVGKGEYVIVPNLTFVASLNSICHTGAEAILIDADKDTWQMDLNLLEQFLTSETEVSNDRCIYKSNGRSIRAVMPVHVLGNMCDMERLMTLCKKYSLQVVEDATEALGSYYKGKHSGTFGRFGCFSYNGNKIITTGGGGMIVASDDADAKKAKHLTTQAKSDAFEYMHDEVGYNYRLVNVLAAIGVAQMEQLSGFILKKKFIDSFYKEKLNGVGDINFQKIEKDVDANCWLFTLRTTKQKEVLNALNKRGFQSRPFWVPMNQLPMFKNLRYITGSNNSENLYQNCLSIPCSTYITLQELEAITDIIKSYY